MPTDAITTYDENGNVVYIRLDVERLWYTLGMAIRAKVEVYRVVTKRPWYCLGLCKRKVREPVNADRIEINGRVVGRYGDVKNTGTKICKPLILGNLKLGTSSCTKTEVGILEANLVDAGFRANIWYRGSRYPHILQCSLYDSFSLPDTHICLG